MYYLENNSSKLEITVPVRNYTSLTILLAIPAVVCCCFIILVLLDFFINGRFEIVKFLGYCFFILFASQFILWFTKGKEEIVIENNTLTTVKKNGFLTFRKEYDVSKIHEIKPAQSVVLNESKIQKEMRLIRERRRAFPFWLKMGMVEISYGKKRISIFNGLEQHEVEPVINLIKTALKHR